MYEQRMKLFVGHFISTLSSAFCLHKNGRQGRMRVFISLNRLRRLNWRNGIASCR